MVNYLALVVALALSAVAAYYSIIGLTTIFASAFIPIVVMGSSLELAKIVATSWVYRNWHVASTAIKYYLVLAIAILMLITSMGTFGYLSKAHMDHNVITGDSLTRLSILDEKIRTAKENIDANRKTLKQMDEAVDQSMARSQDEKGADKAVAIRRGQARERDRILAEIAAEQNTISRLSEERAPIAAEVRKVEAEVGPIKYIAELFYGESSEEVLGQAVRWVIILIVAVFDPLAIVLLIAANQGLTKQNKIEIFPEVSQPKDTWIDKASKLMKKKKKGILEIDKSSIMEMK